MRQRPAEQRGRGVDGRRRAAPRAEPIRAKAAVLAARVARPRRRRRCSRRRHGAAVGGQCAGGRRRSRTDGAGGSPGRARRARTGAPSAASRAPRYGSGSWSSDCSTARACCRSSAVTSIGASWTRSRSCRPPIASASSTRGRPSTTSSRSTRTSPPTRCSSATSRPRRRASTSAPGIFNVTPPVNHPARVAERVAMLDHLSEGRFEFGMGRGSSTTEQQGFGITDPDLTRAMFDEVVGEFRKMWQRRGVPGLRRPVLLDAGAQRAAEAVLRAAPADVGRGRQPVDVREGRAHGARRAVLHDRRTRVGEAARRALQEGDRATRSRSATS